MSAVLKSAKPAYRVPRVCRYQEVEVRLDDFETDDILEYLKHNGTGVGDADCSGGAGVCTFTEAELDRIFTLVLCGQRESALEFILGVIGSAVGRPI